MTFLPIVARELRGAARQPSTYRARTAYALVTSLMAAGLLLLGDLASARRIGSTVFPTLATLAFLYCWITGLRHAADALSEEKREGTLGLLFLTDLRGYDVVLGKLVSVSARTLQGLFAFFPVLALGLVLGGITAGEVWRTAAVLINALFFSLSLGLCVSAFARASHVAIGFSLAALTFVTAVPLALDALLARLWPGPTQVLRFISPVGPATLAFDADYAGRPGRFLAGLALNHVVGWCFLLCASWAVVRTWQERGLSPFGSPFGQTRSRPESPQNRSRRDAERRRRLEINPIFWLAGRHQRQHWLLWVTVGGTALLGIVTISLTFWMGPGIAGLNSVPAAVLDLALRMWVGWYACATLSEAQRTGAVELILATPLSVNQIIEGHTQALQRMFLWPVVVAVVLNLLPAVTALYHQPVQSMLFLFPFPGLTLFSIATLILDLVAVGWIGMWMGLSQPKMVHAVAKTIFLAVILPMLVFCLPNIVLDLFWIGWAKRKLEQRFRQTAAERYGHISGAGASPVAGNPVPLPPIIAR